MRGAPTHRKTVTAIAQKMGLPEAGVDRVVGALFSLSGMYDNLKAPFAVDFPYIGSLVPDMRIHRHLIRRQSKVKYIKFTRERQRASRKKRQ